MAPERSPAFQFYPKDFLSDRHVMRMTMEARGIYITLIALAWLDGDVSSDSVELAGIVNMPVKQFARVWPLVRVCFQERDGRLIQPRVEAEREKQAAYRAQQSNKGQKSAISRRSGQPNVNRTSTGHQPDTNNGSTAVQPDVNQHQVSLVEPEGNSSSSSSSSSSEQPSAVAAAAPRFVGKQKPIPGYRRLRLFPWMIDDMLGMLGDRAEEFDLDKWLLLLDSSGRVLPPSLWPWLKETVSADAAARGFGAVEVSNGTHTNIEAVREILRRDGVIE